MLQFFLRRAQSIRPQQQVISGRCGSGLRSGLSMMDGSETGDGEAFEKFDYRNKMQDSQRITSTAEEEMRSVGNMIVGR
jgi:hypothetical protein